MFPSYNEEESWENRLSCVYCNLAVAIDVWRIFPPQMQKHLENGQCLIEVDWYVVEGYNILCLMQTVRKSVAENTWESPNKKNPPGQVVQGSNMQILKFQGVFMMETGQ